MSHPDPSLVDVRRVADHPLVVDGNGGGGRMVAPGAATGGRYGLVEYRLPPHSRGAEPHHHRTSSEAFYVLSGELTMTAFHARHDQVVVEG